MAKIIIKWNALFVGSACKFDVYLMNTYIGELRCGRTIETTVEPGCYTLFFKPKSIIFRKDATSFTVVVNDEAEIVKLKSKFDFNGKFVITYADNAPHIPKNFANNINSTNEIHQTLTDIKHETKKNKRMPERLPYIHNCYVLNRIYFFVSIPRSHNTRCHNLT